MATIELNNRCHQLVASMSSLRDKLVLPISSSAVSETTAHDPNFQALEHGLDDARLLALVSDYLTGLRRAHSQLRLEMLLQQDELAYVRQQLFTALERGVELEVALEQYQVREADEPEAQDGATASERCPQCQTRRQRREQREQQRHQLGSKTFDNTSDGENDLVDDDWEADYLNESDDSCSSPSGLSRWPSRQFSPALPRIIEESHQRPMALTYSSSNSSSASNSAPGSPSRAQRSAIPVFTCATLRTQRVTQHFARYLHDGEYELAAPVCQRMVSDLQLNGAVGTQKALAKATEQSANSSSATGSAECARDLAAAHEVLARTERARSNYVAAAEQMECALRIHERTLAEGHPSTIAALGGLAYLQSKCGRPQLALPLCVRALRLQRDRYGDRHRSTARQHYNCAVASQQCGHADSALEHYARSLEIYSGTHTVDSRPLSAASSASTSSAEGGVANDAAAADAATCRRKADDAKVQQVVETIRERMAGLLVQQGRLAEAAGVYKDWLQPTTQRMGGATPATPETPGKSGAAMGGGKSTWSRTPMRPIWEVAEEIERNCTAGAGGSARRRSLESYELRCDYREWYDSVRVHFPGACAALKKLAFVYRRMGMHYAAKMLEHCCTLQRRKKALRFGGEQQRDNLASAVRGRKSRPGVEAKENKENVEPRQKRGTPAKSATPLRG